MTSRKTQARVRERKLPIQQLSILAICRFAEPIAMTSISPYLPEMMRSFKVPSKQVGKWVGICSATFSLTQAMMGIPWGRASDRYGRKPAILLALNITLITGLVWGFSTSLGIAIAARAIAGAGNGNVGIIRTTVAEMVPYRELQPRAFSLMPLVWNVASVFGPSIGGVLANPAKVKPEDRTNSGTLFQRFPYALPNIVSACFFLVGIITGFLFLEETLETKRGQRDWGLVLGQKIVLFVKAVVRRTQQLFRSKESAAHADGQTDDDETEPLIKKATDEEHGTSVSPSNPSPTRLVAAPWSEVLNKQAVLNLIVYTLLASHTIAFDSVVPVFMADDPTDPSTSNNPLQFSGGFALDNSQIGVLYTCYGVVSMLVQFLFFPPIARKLGVLYCLKCVSVIFPIAYFLMPFSVLMPTHATQVAVCFALMLVKGLCVIFAFPCSTILLTNSASGMRVLGALNGIATSVSALGRCLGPAVLGVMYTLGAERGFLILPWWFLALFGAISAVPVFALTEGKGFGEDDDDDDKTDDERDSDTETEAGLAIEGVEGEAESAGAPGPVLQPTRQQVEDYEEEEHDYGDVGSLGISRTNTNTSAALSDTEDNANARPIPAANRRPSKAGSTRRRSTRRMSVPFGGRSVSDKYSSTLGQSFGSAGSFHG